MLHVPPHLCVPPFLALEPAASCADPAASVPALSVLVLVLLLLLLLLVLPPAIGRNRCQPLQAA